MAHKTVGIDLAGREKNPTGMCTINGKDVSFSTLYLDKDIIEYANDTAPDIISVDAPLMEGEIRIREGDKELKKYGAMPLTMPSMRELCLRGRRIVKSLNAQVIEVFPTASAKILGFYRKNYRETASILKIKVKNKHELDAYIAALTGILYLQGKTVKAGEIVIPTKPF
ncbi:MAG: DUF429 domain-containing protein [Candidatus Thermoplasmatota archaeon]|nr:DUF429 domain-containing protein [Candidatus Thermoplasmatota archaeon]